MFEKEKIEEAEYFLSQMLRQEANMEGYKGFKYNLSAFLSASRSVLQFALKESKDKDNQIWYDTIISNNNIVKFFQNKRDINIHTEPVNVINDIHVLLIENVYVSDKILESNEEILSVKEVAKKKDIQTPQTAYKYKFNDWIGNEDVPILCQKYIIELKNIVSDGQQKRILSR